MEYSFTSNKKLICHLGDIPAIEPEKEMKTVRFAEELDNRRSAVTKLKNTFEYKKLSDDLKMDLSKSVLSNRTENLTYGT